MMSKRFRNCYAMMVLGISSVVWGGLTTFQQWTFDDDDNPAVPEPASLCLLGAASPFLVRRKQR